MSSARTIEKDKYEVGENQTHDTHVALPTVTRLNNTHSEWVTQKNNQICFPVR